MNAAALAMLVSGMGVGFGWRPMPDGSPRYEYVVQIEPEMLEALAAGQSIPIVAEVPEDVQAIGRIRIVVGRDELPREPGVTRLRPVGDADGAGDTSTVELTQYSEAAPRYGAPVAPPPQYGTPPAGATYDPYTEVPPTAEAPGGGAWNGGSADANPLRTADAGAAAGGTGWNGGGDGAPAGGPLARVGDGLRDAAAPVREGFDRFRGDVRDAADGLGDRTQELLDDLRPDALFGGAGAPVGDAAAPVAGAAPTVPPVPPVWNGGAVAAEAPVWNGGGAADAATAGAAPGLPAEGAGPGTSWNAGAGGAGSVPDYSDAPPLVTEGGASGPTRGADADPWDNAAAPHFHSTPPAAAADAATAADGAAGGTPPPGTVPWPGTTPLFPGAADASAGGAEGAGPVLGGPSGSPQISSAMLDEAATRPLDGDASLLDAAASAATVPAVTAQGWDGATDLGATATATTGAGRAAAPDAGSSARHKAAVILAWVLLSGSAAGNIYLFWSYLDVRTKYRALVRKTARAVGSRFSAA
jgi:hypothetical protein